jgi:hypothetical protein
MVGPSEVLERANEKFEFPVQWGVDLQSERERYLTEEYAKKPVIVMNCPKGGEGVLWGQWQRRIAISASACSAPNGIVATGFDPVRARA